MSSLLNLNGSSSTSSSTKPYQSVVTAQSIRPTALSVTRDLPGSSVVSEARYWAEKFGLGDVTLYSNNVNAKYAHPRSVILNVGSAAPVHQIVIGTTASSRSSDYRNVKHNLLAAVCGPRVPLFGTTPQSTFHQVLLDHQTRKSSATIEADRNVPTSGQLAISASLRVDGRLLAIGTDVGVIRIADTTTRATLAQFPTSTRLAIRAVRWFRDGQHVLSAGDDGVLRVWQLSAGQQQQNNSNNMKDGSTVNRSLLPGVSSTALSSSSLVIECKGHGDAIRCAALWQKHLATEPQQRLWPCHSIAATGSYDHTIRLWDMESLGSSDSAATQRCLSVLQHGAPVEAVEWISSTNPTVPIWLVSAGGTILKVWNPLVGTCVCTLEVQHRKTITSLLSMPRHENQTKTMSMRLLTAGLDGLIRIHSYDTSNGSLRFLHGIDIKTAITSLASTFHGDRMAIGTANGTILVRQMGIAAEQRKRRTEPTAGTFAFFTRGMNSDPSTGDHIVGMGGAAAKKPKLSKHDTALKQFRYGDALDEALETRRPQMVVAVLEELGKRRGLTIALSNRDEESLEPILAFTVRYVSRPRFSSLLIGVAHKLLDIYAGVTGQSETIDELFVKLKGQVSEEIRVQKTLLRVVGQIDSILEQQSA